MNLVIMSHKVCWWDDERAVHLTDGGFPFQVDAISDLFDETLLCSFRNRRPPADSLRELTGKRLRVVTIPEPRGHGFVRRTRFIVWMMRHIAGLWGIIRSADCVHAPIPGELGTVALMVAFIQKKRLFVRHCGTWGDRSTLANRFLAWFLPRIAGGRVVVMATGGGPELPESRNPSIQWIFSTSYSLAEFEDIAPASRWVSGQSLRLVTVGRLTRGKNALACIKALSVIRVVFPGCTLKIVGDGPFREELERTVKKLDLQGEVSFTGNLTHKAVIETLCGSNLFLFPTRVAEGFPKAVLEAMACGLPVIASGVSVLPHLLSEGRGIVLHGTTAGDVATAVLQLTDDPDRMFEMGERAREASKAYTLERWHDLIGERLESAWGCPLKSTFGSGDPTGEICG